jgi:TRAP-type mannitol/chloroaromatic compound transport system permease small subunit
MVTSFRGGVPRPCRWLDGLIECAGRVACWLNGLLVLVILAQVVLRYAFAKSAFAQRLVSLEELQWHLYSVAALFGLSYGLTRDAHVRLDLLHQRLSPRQKELVEVAGHLLLLLPLCAIVLHHGLDFTLNAWRTGERSPSPLGFPAAGSSRVSSCWALASWPSPRSRGCSAAFRRCEHIQRSRRDGPWAGRCWPLLARSQS